MKRGGPWPYGSLQAHARASLRRQDPRACVPYARRRGPLRLPHDGGRDDPARTLHRSASNSLGQNTSGVPDVCACRSSSIARRSTANVVEPVRPAESSGRHGRMRNNVVSSTPPATHICLRLRACRSGRLTTPRRGDASTRDEHSLPDGTGQATRLAPKQRRLRRSLSGGSRSDAA